MRMDGHQSFLSKNCLCPSFLLESAQLVFEVPVAHRHVSRGITQAL